MIDIMKWCEDIITGTGGLHDFERRELAVPKCDRDVAIAAWVIRCLGNGDNESGKVVDAIVARREELAEQRGNNDDKLEIIKLRAKIAAAEKIFAHFGGLSELAEWENSQGESARELIDEYLKLL